MERQANLPGIEIPSTATPGGRKKRTPDAPPTVPAEDSGNRNESGLDDWPPTEEMLRSLFVVEPAGPPPPITVLGIDLGHPRAFGDLSRAHRGLLSKADVICGGTDLLRELTSRGGQLRARIMPLSLPLADFCERLARMRAAGQRIVFLADGDPLFFGIGGTLARHLGAEAITSIPATSSLQEACSRLALPWDDFISLSLHGRTDLAPLNVAAGKGRPLCILTDARMTPDVLARHLLDRGVDWFTAHIFERMGAPDETHARMSLADAASTTFGPSCTMLLLPSENARRPHLGLATQALAADGQCMSKPPIRAAALSLLRIKPGHVVWDIGSGTGAVALEACSLAHDGRVIAIERRPERVAVIWENRRRFGAANLEICSGAAPACLPALPDPHRVFVGGGLSGGKAADILEHACERLRRGGRLVASCVLLDSFIRCRLFLEKLGWPVEIMQLQASCARSLGGDQHLEAGNPVFLLSAQKPAGAFPDDSDT